MYFWKFIHIKVPVNPSNVTVANNSITSSVSEIDIFFILSNSDPKIQRYISFKSICLILVKVFFVDIFDTRDWMGANLAKKPKTNVKVSP